MEKVWAALANELANVSAEAGKSIVGVHGARHFSSAIVIARDAILAASHAVRRDDEITVVTAPGERVQRGLPGADPAPTWPSCVFNSHWTRRWRGGHRLHI